MQFGQRSMECQHIARFLAVLICANSAFGEVSVTGPSAVEQSQDAVFRCSEDPLPGNPDYGWYDATFNNGNPQQLFSGETSYVSGEPKFQNFGVSEGGAVMTITRALVEDEGPYFCAILGTFSKTSDFTVEVPSNLTMTLSTDPVVNGTEFTATCYVNGSRPLLDIAWTLNDNKLDVTPVVTNSTNTVDPDLSDTRSAVTLTATTTMNGQNLKCTTSGHVVMSLNREATTQLNVIYGPTSDTATIDVEFSKEGDKLRVTCQVSAVNNGIDPANPAINTYTFYAGSEQIHSSTTDTSVLVDIPENATDYRCSAGNDLGTIESAAVNYDPGRGLSTAAIVGTVIGVLLFIALVVVLVVIFVLKPDCVSGKGSGPPPKTMALQEQKPTNGNSEKVAHPTAAPRQSTVPHRNDNPGGAVYAEVQKGGRGYDQPDQTHPPQGDSGMNYATLDLSEEAGHTERQVPQNKDNVVVYSSILV